MHGAGYAGAGGKDKTKEDGIDVLFEFRRTFPDPDADNKPQRSDGAQAFRRRADEAYVQGLSALRARLLCFGYNLGFPL